MYTYNQPCPRFFPCSCCVPSNQSNDIIKPKLLGSHQHSIQEEDDRSSKTIPAVTPDEVATGTLEVQILQ